MNVLPQELIESAYQEAKIIREHIHQNPELSFKEYETSKYIQSKLEEYGISYTTGWVETGIVAIIEGKNPEAFCLGIRADMDALPIQEENDVPYKSRNEGVMHACGHDVHSAILLGTAKVLQERRNEINGSIKLIFQPGEEKLPGGANLMIQQGVLENPKVDRMLALHVFPDLEVGKVGFRPGMYMASCDEIHIRINGKGGHGAMPHKVIDPVLISSHLITSLQQIISRNCDPTIPAVLSFGYIHGNGATNVIPSYVDLKGTFRTLNEEWRSKAHQLIKNHSEELVKSMGGTIDIDIQVGYPYLENDNTFTSECKKITLKNLGQEHVVDLPIRMTGEDFSFFSQKVPSCFFRLGVRNEDKGIIHGVHHPKFDIDERAIRKGIETFVGLSVNLLNS